MLEIIFAFCRYFNSLIGIIFFRIQVGLYGELEGEMVEGSFDFFYQDIYNFLICTILIENIKHFRCEMSETKLVMKQSNYELV